MTDEEYMRLALAEAERAEGDTSPNPMVGCLLVDDSGAVVGRGYHHRAGEAHAEVNALAEAGERAAGCTAYVTLEPCSHYGRTGPCCVVLAEAGVKRVVAACADPNPQVAGSGFAYLKERGIEVTAGVCEEEARRLNERFFAWITRRRPFITLKYAMTLDGRIAAHTGDAKWITGIEARSYAHRLRRQHDAVLTGIGTVLADDPELTTRLVPGKNPLRIVLDSRLRTPPEAKVLNAEAPTLLVCSKMAALSKGGKYKGLTNVELLPLILENGRLPLPQLLEELAAREVTSVLVEGGSKVHGAFFDAGLADRVCAFIAPRLVGGEEAIAPVGGLGAERIDSGWQLEKTELHQLGQDILLTGLVKKAGEC